MQIVQVVTPFSGKNNLNYYAPALVWSGAAARKWKAFLTWSDPNLCSAVLWLTSATGTLTKSCAPSTMKVLCPWHHKSSVPLALENIHCADSSCQHEWILGSSLWLGSQTILEWDWSFPIYPGEFSCVQYSTWEWNGLLYHGSWCSMVVFGQSPLAHGNWHWSSVWWYCTLPDVGLSAALKMLYIHCCSFAKRNWFLYNLCCQLTYASRWCCFTVGWLVMSWSRSASHW